MEEVLRFFNTYEAIIYFGLGVLAIWEIRKFALAWEEVRGAAFGMERESAQTRLNRAAILLVLILFMAISEFTLVSFVVPTVPGALPILTPTLDLLATQTSTLPPLEPETSGTPNPGTLVPTTVPTPAGQGCTPGELIFTSPNNGSQVSGKVNINGTVDFPNLGFYKYEVQYPGENIWLPLQAGRDVKKEAELGIWDTSMLPPGDYKLRLMATDNAGLTLGTCEIQVRVEPAAP